MEQALARLQPGHDSIVGIFDVAGFSWANADFQFVDFLVSSATLNDKQGLCFSATTNYSSSEHNCGLCTLLVLSG